MSNTLLRLFVLSAFLVGMTACTDVGVQPKSSQTASTVFSEPQNFKTYLAKLYGGLVLTGQEGPFGNDDVGIFADEGKGGYSRVYWNLQETPTDEVVNSWVNDPAVNPFTFQNWDAENGLLDAMFARIYFQTANVNKFLEVTANPDGVNSDLRQQIQTWRAEARFLRALSYWHGLDLYRNIPLVTQTGGGLPEQASPQDVFDFIEEELLAITDGEGEENLLPAGQAPYGRADRGAAWTLLTKLYLNAEVYIDEPRYSEAATQAQKVIDSGAYSLAIDRPYGDLFRADNHTHPGMIFPLPQDGVRSQTYSNTTFLLHATSGGNMALSNPDIGVNTLPKLRGITGSWLGYRGTPSLVNQFQGSVDSVEVNCLEGVTYTQENVCGESSSTRDSTFWNTSGADSRGLFFTDGQQKAVKEIGSPGETFRYGYGVIKYKNITSDGEIGSNQTFPDTDFPMFRLGDVYLMFAEAVLRGNGNESRAVQLVNDLRDRAFGPNNSDGDVTQSDLTLEFILDERLRELYHEAHRRTDLIRYEVAGGHPELGFSTKGTWAWKGNTQQGTSTPECKNVYPIPKTQITANSKLEQNDGYPGCN